MPFVDWLKRTMREKAQDFIIAPLDERHGAPRREPVEIDGVYVTLSVKAARIVDVRRWTSKFHGCINSRANFLHEAQGNVEHQTVLAPPELKELDPAHLDRIVSIDKVLLGPFPYRGQLGLTIALFSVKSADLAGPYLDLLTTLADTAGVSFLAAAKPYIDPLRKGADLLFGTADASQLEIGFDRDFTALEAGYYLAMRAPKDAVALDTLRIDANDYRLLDQRGLPFGTYPYFILAVETGSRRADWMLIPDLKATWDAMKQAFVAAHYNDAGNLLGQFERECRVSPDLVPPDVQRLVKKARDAFGSQQAGTGTFAGQERGGRPVGFPEFHDLDLYA
jgi:hypothetical protein